MPLVDPDVFAHLSVRLRLAGATPVLSVEGELDRWTLASPEWQAAVAALAGHAARHRAEAVVLDLRRLYFLDLAGLSAFEQLAGLAAAAGGRLALAGTRPRIREFLRQACADFGDEYTGLEELDGLAADPAPKAARRRQAPVRPVPSCFAA